MFDSKIRPLIDPPLNAAGKALARSGLSANAVSVLGLGFAAAAAVFVVAGWFVAALVAIILNRLADGLDGAIARRLGPTDLGGFYDIVFDFFFYGAIPLAFAIHDPGTNGLAAAVLLASFYANGATFLAFAAIAAKRGLVTERQGKKSIYYFAGLAEGAETIAVFCAMCLWPGGFWMLALGFSALCFASAAARTIAVSDVLRHPSVPPEGGPS
ncbi:MAG: CDP-alcohol phosphatidyltransferase family protein [Pseudomonadota bacterium]